MHRVLVLGAGKIGRAIAMFLQSAGDFDVLVADADKAALTKLQGMVLVETTLADAGDPVQLRALMRDRDSVISALVFSANPAVAAAAVETSTSYFDLTEDVATTRRETICGTLPGNLYSDAAMRPSSRIHFRRSQQSDAAVSESGQCSHESWCDAAISKQCVEV